jgi:predicted RNase H-like HicB family nuclease
MKSTYKEKVFPVIIEQDKTGGYVVTNPAFEGCYSQGDTVEEALENIKEATELCFLDVKGKKAVLETKNISLHLITLKNKYA